MTIIVIIVAWHGDERLRLMACLDHRHQQQQQQQPQQQQYDKQRMIMAVVMIMTKKKQQRQKQQEYQSLSLYLDSVFEPLLLELMYAKAGSRDMLMPCRSCCSMGCV